MERGYRKNDRALSGPAASPTAATPPAVPRTAMLHYTTTPVVGGVEAVIDSHARVFAAAGYPVTLVAGRGGDSFPGEALPASVDAVIIPELDTQHPRVLAISAELEQGRVPEDFAMLRDDLVERLRPVLSRVDVLIVHNILTKHFNLPLTAALAFMLEQGVIHRCLGWVHDITWTSENSRRLVFEGYPWDLLRTALPGVQYVTISEQRQQELSQLQGVPARSVRVVYNGVDACVWFGLTPAGWGLVQEMDLLSGDLILLMPVRVTQAKNIELAARVLAALRARACDPRLVVTGPPDPHSESSMAYFRELLDLRSALGLTRELRFVFETGPAEQADEEGYTVSQAVVADLLRVSDLVFLPSHREGFGMPVLEAGLVGTPVVSSVKIPAAREIGSHDVYLFDPQAKPEQIADLILRSALDHPASRLRRRVRQNLTWERIFNNKIKHLLKTPE